MHAPAFHCPACGGPQRHGGPGRCEFCGAVRVPLGTPDPRTAQRCPECTALVAGDHRFCPQCGAAQGEAEPPVAQSDLPCPGCEHTMAIWALDPRIAGSSPYRGNGPQIHGCQSCGGAWVDRRTLDAIIEEAQANAVAGDQRSVPRRTMSMNAVVVYRPCPACGERMNRRNFGRYSGIVVDECPPCGTYFDAGELEGVVAFVRAGGLGLTKQRDAEDSRREQAQRQQMSVAMQPRNPDLGPIGLTARAEIELVIGFLRWVGRWVRRVTR